MNFTRTCSTLAILTFLSTWIPAFASAQSSTTASLNPLNYSACLSSNALGCTPSLLNDVQRATIRKAIARQNYNICAYTYGKAYRCSEFLRTINHSTVVPRTVFRRNVLVCRGTIYTCDLTLLTEPLRADLVAQAQRAEVMARAPIAPRPSGVCAENGSCYGEISAATGRPKTVQVDGYYRKDGTYVRGHYRSKPRK